MNSKRMNRLEELGRVDSEKAYTKKGKENLGAEKSRIVRELKADGGKAGSKKKLKSKKTMMPDLKNRKSRITIPSEVKDMNERIKKKKESGKKDIFDYIGDIIKTPYKIRGGKAMGGRIKKMDGGSLKAIPSENKGLKKLPTQVRNKMGYMKNGGRAKMRSGGLAKRGRGCEIR